MMPKALAVPKPLRTLMALTRMMTVQARAAAIMMTAIACKPTDVVSDRSGDRRDPKADTGTQMMLV